MISVHSILAVTVLLLLSFLGFMGIFILIIIALFVLSSILNFLANTIEGSDEMAQVNHIDGIPNLGNNVKVPLVLYQDKLVINRQQTIPLSRIKGTEFLSQKEIVEYNKSSIGRGILGALVAGPLGGIIGATSGIGSSKGQEIVYYLIVQFINIESKEVNAIFTSGIAYSDSIKKISDIINQKVNYQSKNNISNSGAPYDI